MKELYEKQKINFIITVISIFLVHFTKMTHYLPNWDNMYSMEMTNFNMTNFGRWLAGPITRILTSSYDLQWISGLISALFLGLTICLILDLFNIKSKFLSTIAILIIVTFPSISGAFMYIEWTASYMLSLFMSILAIYLIVKHKSKWRYFYCPILICFSLAIYQIYFLFAITCSIFYIATQLICKNYNTKDYLDFIKFLFYSIILGFILYYVINKIILSLFDIELLDYQGIGTIGFLGIKGYINAIINSIKSTLSFFGISNKHISLYAIINIITLLSLITLTIIILIKNKQKIWLKILITILFVSIIPATFAYYFLSKDVSYHTIMTISLFFIYFEFIVLLDRKLINLHKIFYCFISSVLLVLCFYNFINTNIAYKQLEMSYERTYFEVCEVVQYIDLVNEDNSNNILIVGSFPNNSDNLVSPNPSIIGASTANFLHSEYHFIQYTKYYLGRDYHTCSDEKKSNILNSEEFINMKTYPSKECVKIIEDVVVIKLS